MTKELSDQPQKPSEQDFIQRWSERKLEAAKEDSLPVELTDTAEPGPPEPPGDDDMPPIESLTEESDYSAFLSPRVSAYLQRQALRKLFGIPSFNLRDGLDDYDDDFTSFAALGDVITADIRHRLEREAEALAKAQAESSTEEQLASDAETPLDNDATTDSPSEEHGDPDSTELTTDPDDSDIEEIV